MLELKNVTLVCIDCVHVMDAVRAIEISSVNIKYHDRILFTSEEIECNNTVIKIPKIKSKEEYSEFCLKELPKYIQSEYVLIIQWDGFVLDHKMWDDNFFNYDYIGAAWDKNHLAPINNNDTNHFDAIRGKGYNVGNGGFSLRSKKLLNACLDKHIIPSHPEDVAICQVYRDFLEKEYDIVFADERIASKFSLEPWKEGLKSFGSHGGIHDAYNMNGYLGKSYEEYLLSKRIVEYDDFLKLFDDQKILDITNKINKFKMDKNVDVINAIKPKEQILLGLLVDKYSPKVIVETGTNIGASTSILSMFSKDDCVIYTFDIPDENSPENLNGSINNWGRVFRDTELEDKIIKISKNTNTIKEWLLPDVDMWFIDSDHSIKTIQNETELAIKSGAKILLYHDAKPDLSFSEVYKYLSSIDLHNKELSIINTENGVGILILNDNKGLYNSNLIQRTLTIITPCSRESNLDAIYNSIQEQRKKCTFIDIKWIISVDKSKINKLFNDNYNATIIYTNDAESRMGNAQRNAALQLASEDFVYFLDDDNILHPDFISTIERCIIDYPHKKCFVFNQIDRDGNIRCQSNSDNVRPGYIDIAQYVIHKSIINKNDDGLVVFANDSDKKHRGADGKFIERIYHKNKNSFVFIDKTLCYYNYLQSEYKCGLLGNELIVGLMMTRNESDIIAEILDSWLKRGLKIIAMDDSDDGTFEILQKYPNVIAFKQSEIYPENCIGSGDWMYQGLLEKKRELFGIDNYVILTLGDEFWFFDPTKIVYEMAREGATLAKLESYQFYPHISDKYKFNEDYEWNDNKKFINRLSRHETGWLEDRIFFDNGKCNYAPKQAFRTIPIDLDIKLFSKTYYYGHYHLRSPKQILSRSKDRVTRGYQPFYEHSYNKSLDDTFYSKYPGSSIEKNSVFSTTITIITPCTRENNLKLIEKSIFDQKSKANFVDINWIIVVDNDIIAKLKDETLDANIIYYSDEDSISGNEQRNKGLEFVKDGWVYFLDDDNILHPDFIEIFENTLLSNPKKKGFVFDQIFTTGEIRCLAKEENVRTGYIDTAQFIIHRSIISELWKKNTYDADGYFISSIFNNNKDGFVFINKSFCYYNWLRPKIDIKQNEIERTENNTSPVNVVSNQAIPVRDVRLRRRR